MFGFFSFFFCFPDGIAQFQDNFVFLIFFYVPDGIAQFQAHSLQGLAGKQPGNAKQTAEFPMGLLSLSWLAGKKPTTLRIPRRSPIQVLTQPKVA